MIIQVGPQPRQCFRFNRDLIGQAKHYCYRRHEVWIRRGATSDRAAPEEIKRLLEGKSPSASAAPPDSVAYTRLPREHVEPAVLVDLRRLVTATGGEMFDSAHVTGAWSTWLSLFKPGYQVLLRVEDEPVVLKGFVVERCTTKDEIGWWIRNRIGIQHGLLLIATGNVSSQAVSRLDLRLRELWGWFCADNGEFGSYGPPGIGNGYNQQRFCIALRQIHGPDSLARAWSHMLGAIRTDETMKGVIRQRVSMMQSTLSAWLQKGCPQDKRATVSSYLDILRSHQDGPRADTARRRRAMQAKKGTVRAPRQRQS